MEQAAPDTRIGFWATCAAAVGLNFLPVVMAPTSVIARLAIVLGLFFGSLSFLAMAWRQRSLGFRAFLILILMLPNWAVISLETWNEANPSFWSPRNPHFPRNVPQGEK